MGEIGSASSMFTADKGKQSKQGCVKDHESGQTSIVKDAIVRAINVRYRVHPDFNARGQWDRMKSDRAIRSWQKEEKEIKLTWGKRADGTHLPKRDLSLLAHLFHLATMMRMIETTKVIDVETAKMIADERRINEVVAVMEGSTGARAKVRLV